MPLLDQHYYIIVPNISSDLRSSRTAFNAPLASQQTDNHSCSGRLRMRSGTFPSTSSTASWPRSNITEKSRDHLGSFRCTRPPSGSCTIVSTGRYDAERRDENAGSRHIASEQILPRSLALLDWGMQCDIRRRSRTTCGSTCCRYGQYNIIV